MRTRRFTVKSFESLRQRMGVIEIGALSKSYQLEADIILCAELKVTKRATCFSVSD